jgi:hypothetical protein
MRGRSALSSLVELAQLLEEAFLIDVLQRDRDHTLKLVVRNGRRARLSFGYPRLSGLRQAAGAVVLSRVAHGHA